MTPTCKQDRKEAFQALAVSNSAHIRRCRELEQENADLKTALQHYRESLNSALLQVQLAQRGLANKMEVPRHA